MTPRRSARLDGSGGRGEAVVTETEDGITGTIDEDGRSRTTGMIVACGELDA